MKRLIETLLLKTHREEVHKIEQFAERIADQYNIGDSYFANILLSLTEAFNNAMLHGNKLDEKKNIKVEFYMSNKEMIFVVSDEGFGFNAEDFLKIETENQGRGLLLIKHVSDSIEFEDAGRSIIMTFNTASFNEKLAMQRSSALINAEEKAKSKTNE